MKSVHQIGLALSGGGVRAASFHAGVLKWLADCKEIEKVVYLSTVSGGSLFTGLVFHFSGLRWPTSDEYLSIVLPAIREILTEQSLQSTALRNLILKPMNWRYIFTRANVLARTIETLWQVNECLADLPTKPVWALNGTTGETGVRFRVKGTILGDYDTGYTSSPKMKIATAMAISAAFPVGIGPLTLKTRGLRWFKRESWNSEKIVQDYTPPTRIIHLYDGGLYDNLGIEPLFDVGTQTLRTNDGEILDRLIVSDASPPLFRGDIPFILSPFRAKRLIDITLSQIRKLRVRSFVNFIKNHPGSGYYLQIGQDAAAAVRRLGSADSGATQELLAMRWVSAMDATRAANYPTTLSRMKTSDFDLLAQHGYETAKWNHLLWRVGEETTNHPS